MAKHIYTALTPYTGRAIRFEKAEGETPFLIMEGAEQNAGENPSKTRMLRESKTETIRVLLRGITTKPVPLVKKAEKHIVDGKEVTREIIDEDATLKAIEDDEDAAKKGCPWRAVGHLDMITADSETHLYKLFPDMAELLEVAAIIERAGAPTRLPLSGKARLTVK